MKLILAAAILSILVAGKSVTSPQPHAWQQVEQRATFNRADSSPNASVSFANRAWILAGWSYFDGRWQSNSSVWMSDDCSTWHNVCRVAPYDPYSAFIVFKGSIWAVANNVYRSNDGKEWTLVAKNTPIPISSRISVFQDHLWVSAGRAIWRSADGATWELVTEQAPWGDRQWPIWQAFNGYLWLIGGGQDYNTPTERYFNDIWRSTDGLNWEQLSHSAPWGPRYWNATIVHNGMLWTMGGWIPGYREDPTHEYGNLADTWFSEDGQKWQPVVSPSNAPLWRARHAPYVWTLHGKLYLAGGYGGGGEARLYNDVWQLD